MSDALSAQPLVGSAPSLVVRTVEVPDPGPLLDLLPEGTSSAWVRRGDGIVGWGEAARLEITGADRFGQAARWWDDVVARSVVRDDLHLRGSGLVAFASFAFDDGATQSSSVLVVPSVVVGRSEGRCWVTALSDGAVPARPTVVPTAAPRAPRDVAYADAKPSAAEWVGIVGEAVERIAAGEVDKVVLALAMTATAAEPVDPRWLLQRMYERYERAWTFAVDGLVGATPELLVRLERGLVTSRVLAGTIQRTGDDAHDLALAASLARSSKDLEEHEYAVRSVADALATHSQSTNVPETPFVLHLPNVMHLATDVTAVARPGTTLLGLAASLHPTAAVCGTPRDAANALIRELEGMDRARYAGPVGWLGADGDGELGIALRCAEVAGESLRLFAGCGIVAGSDPEAELAEARVKLLTVRDALG